MDKIKAHYDRFLLAVAGVVLAGVAVMMALNAGGLAERFTAPPVPSDGEPFVGEPAVAQLRADRTHMEERRNWSDSKGSLFVSRVYLLRGDQPVDILESDIELFPGIANTWILEHSLDYTDPGLPDADPDGDGFTNLEEFMAKTNPRDAKSRPAAWTKLRLSEVEIEQMQIIFTSKLATSEAMINSVASANSDELRGAPIGPSRRYAKGDQIKVVKYRPGFAVTTDDEDTPFFLADIKTEQRPVPATGGTAEVSFITLKTKDGETEVVLEQEVPQVSPFSRVTFIDTSAPGNPPFTIRSNQTLPPLPDGTTYKLIDVTEKKAMIQNLDTGEQHEVPFGSPATAKEVLLETSAE
jgi:hypothetical protein